MPEPFYEKFNNANLEWSLFLAGSNLTLSKVLLSGFGRFSGRSNFQQSPSKFKKAHYKGPSLFGSEIPALLQNKL